MGLKTSDYDYDLPPELIAQVPLEDRSASRMMVLGLKGEKIQHDHFLFLPEYIKAGDLIVANDTSVLHSRLKAKKDSGGFVEIFLLLNLIQVVDFQKD